MIHHDFSEFMSLITIILVTGGKMTVSELHYRHVMEILASSCSCIQALATDAPHPAVLDAGYILIDLDSKTIVSRQDAFSLHHLPSHILNVLRRDWDIAL